MSAFVGGMISESFHIPPENGTFWMGLIVFNGFFAVLKLIDLIFKR
jgi:hypothetical protein